MATTDQQMQLKDAMARAKQVSIHKSNQWLFNIRKY